jgi:hypothetical protein
VEFARVVDSMRGIAKKQEKCAAARRDLNGMKMLVERQHRQTQRVTMTWRVKRGDVVVDLKRFVDTSKRIFLGDIANRLDVFGNL